MSEVKQYIRSYVQWTRTLVSGCYIHVNSTVALVEIMIRLLIRNKYSNTKMAQFSCL